MISVLQRQMSLTKGRIGLISDTHGLVRPQALAALKNSELIVHAGDIGNGEVLQCLKRIAPVLAIKGNNDREAWAKQLPDVLNLQVNAIFLHVIHNVNELAENPAANGYRVVISGHSHRPGMTTKEGVLFINPGSAGPRRFKLPVCVARLNILGQRVRAKIVELKI